MKGLGSQSSRRLSTWFVSRELWEPSLLRMNLHTQSYLARTNTDTHFCGSKASLLKSQPVGFSWRFLEEMFLQTVANVLLYSPGTSLFPSLPFDIHSQPFPSTWRTSFESLLLLVNSLACWKHWREKEAARSEATRNAGYMLRYSPKQPPGQVSQLVLRAIWGCGATAWWGYWENFSSEELG